MAIKTISLELDAYEKLKRAKRGKESFSEVVRRARFDSGTSTGAAILEELQGVYRKRKRVLPKKTLDYWDAMEADEESEARISPSAWEE